MAAKHSMLKRSKCAKINLVNHAEFDYRSVKYVPAQIIFVLCWHNKRKRPKLLLQFDLQAVLKYVKIKIAQTENQRIKFHC